MGTWLPTFRPDALVVLRGILVETSEVPIKLIQVIFFQLQYCTLTLDPSAESAKTILNQKLTDSYT